MRSVPRRGGSQPRQYGKSQLARRCDVTGDVSTVGTVMTVVFRWLVHISVSSQTVRSVRYKCSVVNLKE